MDATVVAQVMPVFKKGKRQDVNNHRPISIIPAVAKVFERIIYDQFYRFLYDNDLLAACVNPAINPFIACMLMSLLEASNSWSVDIDNGHVNGIKFID